MSYQNRFIFMLTRGLAFFLCVICSFYNSECPTLESLAHFLQTGVYLSYALVMFGLFVEAAMFPMSHECVLVSFLVSGVVLGVASGGIALYDFIQLENYKTHMMVKFILITLTAFLFIIETVLLYCVDCGESLPVQ